MTHCCLPTALRWMLKMPSSTYLRGHTHLDNTGSIVRISFFDFSKAFNTIRPGLPQEKLDILQVDTSMDMPQFMQLRGCVSGKVVSNTGAHSHLSSSHCTPQTSSTTLSPLICRDSQMTLQLLGLSGVERRSSTEYCTLWHCVGAITFL